MPSSKKTTSSTSKTKKASPSSKKSTNTTKTKNPEKNINFSSQLSWLPKKTFELEITIPASIVKTQYQLTLKEMGQDITVKGFRKGKAPDNLVEKQIGKDKIYDKLINKVVTIAYFSEIKKHNLKPILNPQITPIAMPENQDWLVKATSCEMPEVKLGDYKAAIKGLKAKSTIWTPGKSGQPQADSKTPAIDDNQILDEFIQQAEVELPEPLIDEETNRLVADMVDQIKAAGLTVQQYLDSRQLTQESMRQSYREFAIKSLTLEFAIAKVAEQENIQADQKAIDDLVKSAPDDATKQRLKDPKEQNYLKLVIRKQKTIDFIKSL